MLAAGDPAQRRERLALGAGAEDAELRVGEPVRLLRGDDGAAADLEEAELLGHLDVVEHRASDEEAVPVGVLGGPDHLLQPRDVGGEGGDQHPAPPLRR